MTPHKQYILLLYIRWSLLLLLASSGRNSFFITRASIDRVGSKWTICLSPEQDDRMNPFACWEFGLTSTDTGVSQRTTVCRHLRQPPANQAAAKRREQGAVWGLRARCGSGCHPLTIFTTNYWLITQRHLVQVIFFVFLRGTSGNILLSRSGRNLISPCGDSPLPETLSHPHALSSAALMGYLRALNYMAAFYGSH